MIDEIDIHLHPAWQWRILSALTAAFPKVQFIIATHSPIILSSAKEATVLMMRSPDEVIRLNSTYGVSVNDVLICPQDTRDMPEEIKELYNRAEMIFNGDSEEPIEDLLSDAAAALEESPGALKAFCDFVEVNRWIEEA